MFYETPESCQRLLLEDSSNFENYNNKIIFTTHLIYPTTRFERVIQLYQRGFIFTDSDKKGKRYIFVSLDRFRVTYVIKNLNYKTNKVGHFTCFVDRCCEFSSKILVSYHYSFQNFEFC